jgi:hypothetical protein
MQKRNENANNYKLEVTHGHFSIFQLLFVAKYRVRVRVSE